MPIKKIVLEEEVPNTDDSNPNEQRNPGPSEGVIALAREAGEATAEARHAQEEISELKGRIAILEAQQADTAALRSELAQLRQEVFDMEEEPESDTTLIVPELEPEAVKEPEEPPEAPKQSGIEFILRL